jgi:hypothetical protein
LKTRFRQSCPRWPGRLANNFFLKDRRALSNQISFVLTFSWRWLILAMRDWHRADKNELAISVFSVTAKDLSHDIASELN